MTNDPTMTPKPLGKPLGFALHFQFSIVFRFIPGDETRVTPESLSKHVVSFVIVFLPSVEVTSDHEIYLNDGFDWVVRCRLARRVTFQEPRTGS
jgi:hypothetical protein